MKASEHLRENLPRLRKARGFSQAGLSEALAARGYRLDQTGIAKIERGLRRVHVDDLTEIAAVLGVGEWLLLGPIPEGYKITRPV